MPGDLQKRARALGLHGLLVRWDEVAELPWVAELIAVEEAERFRRSQERRLKAAKIGRFKPLADFDWSWPTEIDRPLIEELMTLEFARTWTNVVLVGPNGLGKTLVAQNLADRALASGMTVRFTTASAMLTQLAQQDGAKGLERAIRRYARPALLIIDELGYLSYDNRYADLLFEIVNRRYEQKSTVITTNKAFGDWNEVFPNAACVVTLVDRLVHHCEIAKIDGESYRLKDHHQDLKNRISGS